MLPSINLDNQTFDDILMQARNMIPALTDEWTDFNLHDPGITLLELFSWLKESQQYYMNAIGDIHIRKYLRLLGCEPENACPAEAYVTFSTEKDDCLLPQGLKMKAKDIVFELERSELLLNNKVSCVATACGEQKKDISAIALHFDFSSERVFSLNSGDNAVYIGFEKPLPVNKRVSVYIQIHPDSRRNPPDKENFPPLADLQWEFFDGENWLPAKQVSDGTLGFLKNGTVDFLVDAPMAQSTISGISGKHSWLRCRLARNNYELLPRIQTVSLNTFKVVQRDTWSFFFEREVSGDALICDNFISLYGEIEVYEKKGDGYVLLTREEDYRIERNSDGFVCIVFLKAGLSAVGVVCFTSEMEKIRDMSGFIGTDYQERVLETGNIDASKFKLWQNAKNGAFHQLYMGNAVPGQSYELNVTESRLEWDIDNNGYVPVKNNLLRIVDFAKTLGNQGNVKAGEINFLDIPFFMPDFDGISLKNYSDAAGGKRNQTLFEAVEALRATFFEPKIAATRADYEYFVRNIPGVAVNKILAANGIEFYGIDSAKNKVVLVVKPYGNEPLPALSDVYKQYIREKLEKVRLLSVEIEIRSPQYIPVDVSACVRVRGSDPDIRRRIYEAIYDALDGVNGARHFGQEISHSELFGILQGIKGVEYIESLGIEASGKNTERKMSGNISLAPDMLTYLRNLDLEIKQAETSAGR